MTQACDFFLIVDGKRGLLLFEHHLDAAYKIPLVLLDQVADNLLYAPLARSWMTGEGSVRQPDKQG
jgi:hypothetical protein